MAQFYSANCGEWPHLRKDTWKRKFSGEVEGVKHDRSARTRFPTANAIDGLIVLIVCSTVFVAYLRFSEPFRMARPGTGAVGESLRVELCMPSGSVWLLTESIEGYEGRDPRSGITDVRLQRAYRDSDSSTRVEAELVVRRDSDGTVYFRGRPLVLGMKLRFDTPEMIVEGSLCRIESGNETR